MVLQHMKCDGRHAEKWTLRACFAEFGAKATNPRWGRSARSRDGTVVVVTLWKDYVDYSAKPIVYDTFNRSERINRPGNRDRIDNLLWARDHCGSRFRVVIIEAEDDKANTRKIARRYPLKDWRMRLTKLNEETGEFRAEKVAE